MALIIMYITTRSFISFFNFPVSMHKGLHTSNASNFLLPFNNLVVELSFDQFIDQFIDG